MLSELTLGTVQFGLDYGINNKSGQPTKEKCFDILDYGYEHGITSLDTAQAYGNSEAILGEWLLSRGVKDMYITSKIPTVSSQAIKKHQLADYLENYTMASLEKLDVNALDNLLIHHMEDVRYYGEELFLAMKRLKERGYVANYGCSIYTMEDLELVSHYDMDTIQLPANLFQMSLLESDKLQQMKSKGVKVFVRSVFLQGLFFMKPSQLTGNLARLKNHVAILHRECELSQNSISSVALNMIKNHEQVDSVVIGVDDVDQLRDIVSASPIEKQYSVKLRQLFRDIPPEWVDPREWRLDHG